MTTLRNRIEQEIKRLESQFGSDNRYVNMLKAQLNDTPEKNNQVVYQTSAKGSHLDLMNLPIDPVDALKNQLASESDKKTP